ncbi:glycosyltransferase [Microlunatus elymi]|uniref:glycosyltransferase n=1 Tax=Microlunatus elymi TaxID=2596828 RepID=UPI00143DFB7B|nr:glycosyltransferase [Microlunatus elymi]
MRAHLPFSSRSDRTKLIMKSDSPRVAPLQIAVVCDYALDYLGGAQTALLQEAAAVVAAGGRVVVLSPSSQQVWQQVCPDDRIDHVTMPARWTLPGLQLPVLRNTEGLRRQLQTILVERSIDIVHLQSEFGLSAAAAMAARRLGLPVVHTVHTFFWQAPRRGQFLIAGLVRRFHRRVTGLVPTSVRLADPRADSALRNMTLTVARQADLVISPSAHQAERLRTAGLEQVTVLANTVSTLPEAAPLTDVVAPLKIIWIGRCVPEKRILTFVNAAVRAAERLDPGQIQFTVAGDGSQLAEAREIAAGHRQIRFLGRQDHDRIGALLADAHLLALTSRGFDNQPMTIVEAVMAMRGVVYCDPALTEGLAGPGISSPASDDALSDTFVDLVRHPEQVIKASQAAAEEREQFSPGCHAATLLKLYRGLIRSGGRGIR